jgi:molecular chaperone GrpE
MAEEAVSTTEPIADNSPDPSRESGGAPRPESASNRAAELEDRLVRALADLDNVRKRCERELKRERDSERARVVTEWLPVIDNLELALRHSGSSAGGLADGVAAVHDQAVAVLDQLGFRRFEDLGCPFDPMRHEAVGTTDADAPAETVVATVRPGYGSDGEVLRPAKVVVARSAR